MLTLYYNQSISHFNNKLTHFSGITLPVVLFTNMIMPIGFNIFEALVEDWSISLSMSKDNICVYSSKKKISSWDFISNI